MLSLGSCQVIVLVLGTHRDIGWAGEQAAASNKSGIMHVRIKYLSEYVSRADV